MEERLINDAMVSLVSNMAEVVESPDEADIVFLDRLSDLQEMEAKSLVLVPRGDEDSISEFKAGGVDGLITRDATGDELRLALRSLAQGNSYLHPTLVKTFLQGLVEIKQEKWRPYKELPTPRELDVLKLIARGYTNKQAAQILGISIRTVESHRANLMSKLYLRSRVELVRYARENGYLD